MGTKRRKFGRPLGGRRYRKLFVVATEGAKTEPQYFAILNNSRSVIQIECIRKGDRSSPAHVLKCMRRRLANESLRADDAAWLVVDRDKWQEEQLAELHRWSQEAANYGLALSNPSFEYWLLLHFENGDGVSTPRACTARLRRHVPAYDKGIASAGISLAMVRDAIRRAKRRDTPACEDWPRRVGGSTVYRLVERILDA